MAIATARGPGGGGPNTEAPSGSGSGDGGGSTDSGSPDVDDIVGDVLDLPDETLEDLGIQSPGTGSVARLNPPKTSSTSSSAHEMP